MTVYYILSEEYTGGRPNLQDIHIRKTEATYAHPGGKTETTLCGHTAKLHDHHFPPIHERDISKICKVCRSQYWKETLKDDDRPKTRRK